MSSTPHADPLDAIQHACAVLARRAEFSLMGAADAAGEPMNRASYTLLAHLIETGPQTMSALVHAFDLNASTITRQVADLTRRGHAQSNRSVDQPRMIEVAVTDAGIAAFEAVRAGRRKIIADHLSTWPDDELASFARMLTAFTDAFAPTSS